MTVIKVGMTRDYTDKNEEQPGDFSKNNMIDRL